MRPHQRLGPAGLGKGMIFSQDRNRRGRAANSRRIGGAHGGNGTHFYHLKLVEFLKLAFIHLERIH